MQRQDAHGIARLPTRRRRPGARFRRILDRQHAIEADHLHQRQAVRAQHALQGRQHRRARHRAAGLRGDRRLNLAVDDIVKTQLIAEAIYAQDNQATLARWYGAALTTGLSIDDIRSWPDRIRAVTAEQVRAAAQKWLDKKRSVTGYLIKDTAPKREEKRS